MQHVQKTILVPIQKYQRLVEGVRPLVQQQQQPLQQKHTDDLPTGILQEGNGQEKLSVDQQRLQDMEEQLQSGVAQQQQRRPPGISVQSQKYPSKKKNKTFKWIAL